MIVACIGVIARRPNGAEDRFVPLLTTNVSASRISEGFAGAEYKVSLMDPEKGAQASPSESEGSDLPLIEIYYRMLMQVPAGGAHKQRVGS